VVETLDDVLSQVRGVFADPRVALDELEAKWRFFLGRQSLLDPGCCPL
jgi:hypothetical protein